MATVQQIMLQYVCPGLGAAIAFVMFSSPMKAVREVNRRKYLGDLNALPFAMMAANCISWIIYGFLNHDYFVYCANIPGLVFGLYYVLVCFKFSKEVAQDALTYILLGVCSVVCAIGLIHMAAIHTFPDAKTLWGSFAVGVLALYYSAPMSTLYRVVKTRCSSSLYWPLCLANCVNGALWFAYGLALRDWFICIPNGVGAAFQLICLGFCFAFPRGDVPRQQQQQLPHVGRSWSLLRLQSVRYPAPPPANNGDCGHCGGKGAAAAAGDAARISDNKLGAIDESSGIPIVARAGCAGSSGGRGAAAAAAAAGHARSDQSFLDLAQGRWRSGRSFRLGSLRSLVSFRSSSSKSLPASKARQPQCSSSAASVTVRDDKLAGEQPAAAAGGGADGEVGAAAGERGAGSPAQLAGVQVADVESGAQAQAPEGP